ncbi:hypothetical protein BT63DRAFT_455413 [Microthyrium microscopicum]|uniref:Apple domain-containing protein n=1 Tax=Microthyrium microscopicum TaxID=703497 RepID=A0A6A6UAZ4_9PEZI|nr:hypothetical protein BT63DRAFT_455413 [Microthyrium microscopicum]
MHLLPSTLILSLITLTTAAGTCSSSGSMSWPPVGDCATPSRFDTTVQTCRACCMNDADCFSRCLKAGGLARRDTIGAQFFGAIKEKRNAELVRRATLTCVTNEGCYKFTDGSLLCLNLGTGDYHDDVGGNGNYYSGVYTSPDGKTQTGTSSATSTGGNKASSSVAKSSATGSGTSSKASGAAASVTSIAGSAASSAAASATSNAGSEALRVGANVGLVGLVAGLIL